MKRTTVLIAILLLGATTAQAAGRPPLGARAGYTTWDGNSQIHLGGHVKLGDLFPNIALTPGFELGFGDDLTVLTVNGDVYYRATEFSQGYWNPYLGGSVSINWVDAGPGSDTKLGLSVLAGTTHALANGNEVLGEVRFGLLDSPDFKLTFGYTFF